MRRARKLLTFSVGLTLTLARGAPADDVILKNQLVYRGTLDRDNALRMISDGLKRVILYDSKIERILPGTTSRNGERFAIVQPMKVHAGTMPPAAVGIQSTPWDEKGRREFRFINPKKSAPVRMSQAIIDLGPQVTVFRGIDGFWRGQMPTKQVPKEVVLGMLGRVDRSILNERQRIARFLLQAEWYEEARKEVESISKDFPDEKDRCKNILRSIEDLDSRAKLIEIGVRRKAQQPLEVAARLKSFPKGDGVAPDVLSEHREQLVRDDRQAADDRKLGEGLRELADKLPEEAREAWKSRAAEVLKALSEAPDAVRARLDAYQQAETTATPEERFSLAMSGWIAGTEVARASLADAENLWKARSHLKDYLRAADDGGRGVALEALSNIELGSNPAMPEGAGKIDPELLAKIIERAAPPLHEESGAGEKAKSFTNRVRDDQNSEPTEYRVLLPPEYHPLRAYPAVVALHGGRGPQSAIDWWAAEAARHGYIVIAPEYNLAGMPRDYRYTAAEHAAVELSLRDARKRYAIDSDRVFLGGQLLGANMALDYGLAHPDLFAGIVSISGLPAKYVFPYRANADNVALYVAIGDLAPAVKEVVFEQFVKPMILDTLDVTYLEHIRRGLEDLPEEAADAFDWMDKKRRDPYPKTFEVATARPGDARFFGVVVQEHAAGRVIAPEAAEPLGRNIKPAKISLRTSALSNLVNVTATGINRLDVWLGPKQVDFKKKVEVRVNGRSSKFQPKLDLVPMLTDVRFRGDRQQLYWLKVPFGSR